jgi:tetratricopeptide (TPR) repeat protein
MNKTFLPIVFAFLACTVMAAQSDYKTLINEGTRLHDQRKFEEAIAKYQQAAAIDPNKYDAWYEMGFSYRELKIYDKAQENLKKAIELEPKCWHCLNGMGQTLDDAGKPEEALTWYEKAEVVAPARGNIQFSKAITYLRLKRTEEAIAALRKAEQLEPKYPSPYFLLGRIYYTQGKLILAGEQWQKLKELESDSARTKQIEGLINVSVNIDSKLPEKEGTDAMAYCISLAGSLLPENARKSNPQAENIPDDIARAMEVHSTFLTIARERKAISSRFKPLVVINDAGYLKSYLLTVNGDRYAKDKEAFIKSDPGKLEEFQAWAQKKKIDLAPIDYGCEVKWMGRNW